MSEDKRKETFVKASRKRRNKLGELGKVRFDAFIMKETKEIIDTVKDKEGYSSKGEALDYICSDYVNRKND